MGATDSLFWPCYLDLLVASILTHPAWFRMRPWCAGQRAHHGGAGPTSSACPPACSLIPRREWQQEVMQYLPLLTSPTLLPTIAIYPRRAAGAVCLKR